VKLFYLEDNVFEGMSLLRIVELLKFKFVLIFVCTAGGAKSGYWRGACLRNVAWVKALSEEGECAGALRLEKYRFELLKNGSSDEGLLGLDGSSAVGRDGVVSLRDVEESWSWLQVGLRGPRRRRRRIVWA
jgi:hypothetical protein